MAVHAVFLAFSAGRLDGELVGRAASWLRGSVYGATAIWFTLRRRPVCRRDGGRQLALDQRLRRALRSGTLPADADGLIWPLTARFKGALFGAVAVPVATVAVTGWSVYRAVTATDLTFEILAWVVAVLLVMLGMVRLTIELRARRVADALLIQWSERERIREAATA
ncbi:hypothetical protein V6N00_04505 [Tersicoccus sp. MR15.9]|uniref:hypothetical protein n=1 Tax=Tersicoccus mangrovi TaxID=3121635 RepID=UPI002FE54794